MISILSPKLNKKTISNKKLFLLLIKYNEIFIKKNTLSNKKIISHNTSIVFFQI